MKPFEVGQRVKVIISEEDDLGFVDTISAIDEDGLICVGDEDLPYPRGCWHTADELAPAPAPTGDGAVDDDDETEPVELSIHRFIPGLWRVTHVDGVASMELIAEVDSDDSGYSELLDELSGRIKGLERERDALQEQLRKKDAQQKMYKHTIELHEEQYNQARDNATLIRRALQKHAPEAWAEVAKQLNQNVNEYDKLMSDASRGREALGKLAATEAERDAARELLYEKGLVARRYIDALQPFANQWAEWIKSENEWVHDPDTAMDIVDFFADYADNDVVAKHLKAAYDALQATGGEA